MSEVHLGKAPPADAGRDATHVAVVPVIAAHILKPGRHVGLMVDGRASDAAEEFIGIVDPFLIKSVARGELFYLCLYPRSVTGLRHVYTHPVLDKHPQFKPGNEISANADEAREWLTSYCNGNSSYPDVDTMLEAMTAYQDEPTYDYLRIYGQDAHGEIPQEVWDHAEVVLGKRLTKRASYFTCSC